MRNAVVLKLVLVVGWLGAADLVLQAQVLVSAGVVWKYFDLGMEPGTEWKAEQFPDESWSAGPAPLGYGTGTVATTVGYGPDPENKYPTTYFRHRFSITGVSTMTNLSVHLWRDDGAIVYLNGTEVFRSNMPSNAVEYATYAAEPGAPGDTQTNHYHKAIPASLLKDGENVLAVEIHQSTNNGPDIRFDLMLEANYAMEPPQITLTSPARNLTLNQGYLDLAAVALDAHDAVDRVEFYAGDNLIAQDFTSPYAYTWRDIARGDYQVYAIAVSSQGLRATSSPPVWVHNPALVASNSNWKYFDLGAQSDAEWTTLNFDDSAWPSGLAKLGYGGLVNTVVSRTNSAGETNITTYFRHRFWVEDPAAISRVTLRLLRDDGGVVYVNGAEVFRSNLPEGPISTTTLASSRVDAPEEWQFYATNVAVSLLVQGWNVVAAEVHQIALTSSDFFFDLELLPDLPLTPPVVNIASPENGAVLSAATNLTIAVAATDYDSMIEAVDFYLDATWLGRSSSEPYTLTCSSLPAGFHELRAVAGDFSGLNATSAPVLIHVADSAMETVLIPKGATWKYLDDGVDQGTNWVEPDFDDQDWLTGPAPFGTNQQYLTPATVIRVATNIVTSYYRYEFSVANAGSFTNLAFRLMRDDGALVYLNGLELFRMNMRPGVITNLTPGLNVVTGSNATNYYLTNLVGSLLAEGRNVLAVELHQSTSGGTALDAAFDLKLKGTAPPVDPGPTPLTVARQGNGLRISWTNSSALLQSAPDLEGPWSIVSPIPASPYSVTNATGTTLYYRLYRP